MENISLAPMVTCTPCFEMLCERGLQMMRVCQALNRVGKLPLLCLLQLTAEAACCKTSFLGTSLTLFVILDLSGEHVYRPWGC